MYLKILGIRIILITCACKNVPALELYDMSAFNMFLEVFLAAAPEEVGNWRLVFKL